MASDGNIPPSEELTREERDALFTALAHGVPPAGEARGVGAGMWTAFFAIRDGKGALGRMSISAVVRHAGCTRGPLATKGGRFRLLREAIRGEMLSVRAGEDAGAGEASAAAEDRRDETIVGLRKRLQVSDSLNAAYEARAIKAEREARRAEARASRFLAELNERDDGA